VFGFFTLAAGSDVLAARLAGDGHTAAATVLLVIGGASWVLLNYGLPLLIAGPGRPAALAGADGSWFLWPVATQSVAVGLTSWPAPLPAWAAALAVACWAVGVLLYLLVAGLVTVALATVPAGPAGLTPAYWVFMGASAISVLAGAQIMRLPPSPLVTATSAVVAGLSVTLWAFGSWLGARRSVGRAGGLGRGADRHGRDAAAPAQGRREQHQAGPGRLTGPQPKDSASCLVTSSSRTVASSCSRSR
jgi:hypothetical protein